MSLLTILITISLCIAALNTFSGQKNRYAWLLMVGLPLSFAVNRLVKIPLLTWTAHTAGIPLTADLHTPLWFLLVILFNAPVWEEASKAAPLLLPGLRKFLGEPGDALWAGMALGMGFGLGEILYLAYGLAVSPQFSSLLWYGFTGFAVDRLMMTFGHGLMTAQAAVGMQKQGWHTVSGYLVAIGLHALINLGALLAGLKLIDPQIGSLLSYAGILAAFYLFQRKVHSIRKGEEARSMPNEKLFFTRNDIS
jgi:hypothetical protein